MKKQTKPNTNQQDDSQIETRILLEEMNKGIKTIGEQHGTIIKKLEEHDRRFDRIEMAVKEVDAKVDRLEKKLDTTISQNEERFKRIEDKIGIA